MCFNCGDFIDQCFTCGNPNAGPYEKAEKFYVGMTFCMHLQDKHGHPIALWSDRYGEEDD